jgi:hypothetical protein
VGDRFDHITDRLAAFIRRQHLFFVATAPLAGDARVNLSPKGLATLRILGPNRVAYLDLTGSGNETSAHITENGRITFMFCALEGPAQILRLYGRGRTILPGSDDWDELIGGFELLPGARQIIVADIDRVQTSCGWGVPLYEYQRERPTLVKWAVGKGEDWLEDYRCETNSASIDGLPTPIGERNQADSAAVGPNR